MDLEDVLGAMIGDGLSLALVVGRDGLLVEGKARDTVLDLESIGAMATGAMVDMERMGRAVAGGNLAQMRLRFDSYILLIEAITTTDVLVAGAQGANGTERLLDAVARSRTPLQQALSGL
jgi:predicted regulator of Ras-like GTPase activity (Roadblock/LC7/MglB family)